MKVLATILAGAALTLAGTTAASAETRAEKAEARLAKMLDGRVPGEPVSCVTTVGRDRDVQVIDRVGVVYDAGDTIYVARATKPNHINSNDILVIDRFGGQLCTTDMMRTIDQTGNFTGVLFLNDFVPYHKG